MGQSQTGQEVAIFRQALQISDRIPTQLQFSDRVIKILTLLLSFPKINILAPNFAVLGENLGLQQKDFPTWGNCPLPSKFPGQNVIESGHRKYRKIESVLTLILGAK